MFCEKNLMNLVIDCGHCLALGINSDALNHAVRIRDSLFIVISFQIPNVNGAGLISDQQFRCNVEKSPLGLQCVVIRFFP